jgi:hypothetical protein
MKARWITVSALAVLLAALTPLSAQAATLQDPDDVAGALDIKSATVEDFPVPGEQFLAFTLETYEPFDCDDLAGSWFGFVGDFPTTPDGLHSVRFRVRCDHAGLYYWTVRNRYVQGSIKHRMPSPDAIERPSSTTVKILLDMDWYLPSSEVPTRWKVISESVERDAAPDQGWGEFTF